MNSEIVFRSLTLLLLCLIVGISALFRHRANRNGGKLDGQNGLQLVVVLRLFSLIVFLPLLAYLINPAWVAWAQLDLPNWLRWLGVAGGVLSIPLAIWIFTSIGENISPSHATRQNHQLVTHGPYRWVRHPLYSVGLLFWISLTLVTTLWPFGIGMFIPLAILFWRVPLEEARLVQRFGAEYQNYIQRTGRFLPKI
jgi:Putative protein-S-isoprenylcysteine methyltransferase